MDTSPPLTTILASSACLETETWDNSGIAHGKRLLYNLNGDATSQIKVLNVRRYHWNWNGIASASNRSRNGDSCRARNVQHVARTSQKDWRTVSPQRHRKSRQCFAGRSSTTKFLSASVITRGPRTINRLPQRTLRTGSVETGRCIGPSRTRKFVYRCQRNHTSDNRHLHWFQRTGNRHWTDRSAWFGPHDRKSPSRVHGMPWCDQRNEGGSRTFGSPAQCKNSAVQRRTL